MKKIKSQTLRILILLIVLMQGTLFADITLSGYLHPGDNDGTQYIPKDPLTNNEEHTYNYYLNNPTKFYLSEAITISNVELVGATGIASNSNIRVYIDGNLVATGADGANSININKTLSQGFHTIAFSGSCYRNNSERDCSNNNINDIDDFYFSSIKLTTPGVTTAYHFIDRVHLGDNNDADDDYDIDTTLRAYYPDAPNGISKEYDIGLNQSLSGFRIFISRVREIDEDGINKVEVYDINDSLIVSYDINHADTSKFDFDKIFTQSVSSVGKIVVKSGLFTNDVTYDDISFGELVFIPYSSLDFLSPVIDYRMDECSWDVDSNTYEIKNYGTLGDDYNATALNDANVTDGKIYTGGDISATDISDKAVLVNYVLPEEFTLSLWIKFPLNTGGHTTFNTTGWPWWNQTQYQYYNIVDRVGSSEDFIYFTRNVDDDIWTLNVRDDSATDSIDFNPQALVGWHMLTFIVTNSSTKFYINDNLNNTFSTHPNSGILGLLFNSDYGSSDNTPNGQSIGASVDEFKIFDYSLDQTQIVDIFNNESSGKNWDGSTREMPQCGDQLEPSLNFKFDVWDTFRDITDRNISTKISDQEFSLIISSLDEDGTSYQDFNGTVCAKIDNNTTKLFFSEQNTTIATFKVGRAIKDVRVELAWRKDVDENCPLVNEDNSTFSTDNFAIRPDAFSITSPVLAYAGEDFNISFSAGGVLDYNETINASFVVESNISISTCANGVLHVEQFSFEDGIKAVDANYSDIGDINITIKEKLGNEFALVDSSDTNDSHRLITPYSRPITIKPYELNITDVEYDEGWLYMADVSDIPQKVKFSVVANDKQHNIVQNFIDACYAKDVDVKTNFVVLNPNSAVEVKYDDNTTQSIDDINRTITIQKASFVASKADVEYSFNIERNYKIPYEPIKIGLREVNIESVGVAKVENNVSVSLDRDFYYGRVKVEDINTNEQSILHSLHVEVYKLGMYQQHSLNWYQNESDTNTSINSFATKTSFSGGTDKSGVNIENIANMSLGKIEFDITNTWTSSDGAMIHLDIPVWLWSSQYNDYNSSGDCSEHPCFVYRYIKTGSISGVKSGDFKGSSIGSDFNATRQRIGVKTFR